MNKIIFIIAIALFSSCNEIDDDIFYKVEKNKTYKIKVVGNSTLIAKRVMEKQLEDDFLETNIQFELVEELVEDKGLKHYIKKSNDKNLASIMRWIENKYLDNYDAVIIVDKDYNYSSGVQYKKTIIINYSYHTGYVLSHELGHFLGLDHHDKDGNIMQPVFYDFNYKIFNEKQLNFLNNFFNLKSELEKDKIHLCK